MTSIEHTSRGKWQLSLTTLKGNGLYQMGDGICRPNVEHPMYLYFLCYLFVVNCIFKETQLLFQQCNYIYFNLL